MDNDENKEVIPAQYLHCFPFWGVFFFREFPMPYIRTLYGTVVPTHIEAVLFSMIHSLCHITPCHIKPLPIRKTGV